MPSTLLFLDTLERRLSSNLPVQSHLYDVCPNGCMLFQKNDDSTMVCSKCQFPRFSESGERPIKQMKMMSVGDQIARLLVNDKIREMMKYRHNYAHEGGVYRDYFDGQEYQKM